MVKLVNLFALIFVLTIMLIGCQDDSNTINTQGSDLNMARPLSAAIGDFVWYDDNMDGIQDEDEAGISGVTVILYDCLDNVIEETATDEDGLYMFSDIEAGEYYIKFFAPDDYVFTLQDQGDDDEIDSDADPLTGMTICTTIDDDENDITWDAGMYEIDEGCTYTKGYWKNHAGFGPQPDVVTPLLPVWLGNDDGSESIEVADAETAVNILRMRTYGHPSNGITKLYAQLLAAKLNIENGASDEDIAEVIDDADDFLADNSWENWNDLSHDDRSMVLDWKDSLDSYNNGYIGPGHCDEEESSR